MVVCSLCLNPNSSLFFEREDSRYGKRIYHFCQSCNLVFLDSDCFVSREDEKSVYDHHENSPENKGYVDFLNKLIDPIVGYLPAGSKGLDYGSGPGPTLSGLMKKRGFDVALYDPIYSPDRDPLLVEYDFVTCTEVIEHFQKPREEIDQLEKLLKGGQSSYLGFMTQFRVADSEFGNWWYQRDPTHICFYSEKTFQWIANWKGWKLHFVKSGVVFFKS